ncbi:MFS transporter [Longispora albida]|uniref:MFS transporter n=1 Tax=Longispora albida TaxID=203523 RepID=UPI0012F9F6EE|nr:MFS transporter [Longispora albida]
MPALATYRGLLRATSPGFLLLAFLARLPAAMGALGTLTLVAHTTGSFAAAGIAAGALGLGAALGGPLTGALADRYGQRPVGVITSVFDALAYASLLILALGGAPVLATAGAAFLAGFANPQVGPLVRVRWAVLLGDRGAQRQLPAAMSYEGAADETSYVLGPALVGVLALTGQPMVPLLGAIALLLVFGVLFALHPTTPPVVRLPAGTSAGKLPADLIGLIAAMACIGVVFGATQSGITALAGEAGGLIYSVMGVGSIVAGLATAALPARFALHRRYVAFAGALFLGAATLLFARSAGTAAIAMAILGVAVAPYLITVYALAERIAPRGRVSTALTLVTSGTVAGIAAGAAIAGALADAVGYRGAFAVPVFAGLLALALASLSARRLARIGTGTGTEQQADQQLVVV